MMTRMSRFPALVLSLLLASSTFAQAADLAVTLLEAPETALPGQLWTMKGSVTNLGPDVATEVTVSTAAGLTQCENRIDSLAVGEVRTYECTGSFPTDTQIYLLSSAISVWAPGNQDQNANNDSAFKLIRAITPPDLFTWSYSLFVPEPGLAFPIRVEYGNRAQKAATNTTVTIDAPAGFGHVPDNCSVTGNRVVCNVGTLDPPNANFPQPATLELEVIAPDASAHAFDITTTVDAAEDDARPADDTYASPMRTYRTFNVTNGSDADSGSFRAAIEAANAECTDTIPCLIAFRIPPGAQAWHTIALASPLPRIVQRVFVDGTTQARYFGDTNPAGPEIEISGSALREGNGLEVQCNADLRGMAINGFPDNGISVLDAGSCVRGPINDSSRGIRGNYIGTDPTGTIAIPNTRGVRINAPGWYLADNIISGNTRAGVFVASGATHISNNRIGLDAHNQPLGNGAAGVFIGGAASGSDVSNNYIGFNHEFGVAIAGDANYVSANKNSMQGNYQQGIDWGLDGTVVTTKIALPVITSVRFEDGNTIIEGTTTANGTFAPAVTLYANDAPDPSGYGEGQYVLGEVGADYVPGPGQPMHFTFVAPSDLRGKWITATVTHQYYNGWLRKAPPIDANDDTGWGYYTTTSEFSRAWEFK